tara:strand:+ start:25584 stop:26393 length:810 start_codon:yes stop_codon:yes gene_type:complete
MTKLIAEIGWNFLGDMTLAKEMISSAKESGADFAKFQTWSTKDLIDGPWFRDNRIKLYRKSELSVDQHFELFEYCKKKRITFLTSVFNKKYLDFLRPLKLRTIKVASMEITNSELLKKMNSSYKNIIISTGASKLDEVKKVFKFVNKKKCVLMHCVSAYPTPAKNVNLPRINVLKKICKRVGYSGHLRGISDAIGCLSYDPVYIEKHFTINRNLPGRDNEISILPNELKILSQYIKEREKINKFMGSNFQKVETEVRNNYRNRWVRKND